MTVLDVLTAAREAAIEIRRIEEQAEIRRQAIGPQGYSLGIHSKNGILDPMRKVDDLMEWMESESGRSDLQEPIDEAWDVVNGGSTVSSDADVEIIARYYLQGEGIAEIVSGSADGKVPPISDRIESMSGLDSETQAKAVRRAMKGTVSLWESIGIAHLKEMGRR